MKSYILTADADTQNLARQRPVWESHGICIDPVQSMQEAIGSLGKRAYLAVGINADNIHYKPQLGILRRSTSLPIHIITSRYNVDEHAMVPGLGADACAERRESPEENVARGIALSKPNESSPRHL